MPWSLVESLPIPRSSHARAQNSDANPFEDRYHVAVVQSQSKKDYRLDAAPPVSPLRHQDIERVVQMSADAFRDDPMMRYASAGRHSKLVVKIRAASFKLLLNRRVSMGAKRHHDFVVDRGNAVLLLDKAPSQQTPPDFYDRMIGQFVNLTRPFLSKEQKKREAEIKTKVALAEKDYLGDLGNEAYYLNGLATAPEYQGRGYASALVSLASEKADSEGRDMWLGALAHNVGFYELHGFRSIGSCMVGDDNPDWDEEPIMAHVMLRPALGEKR